MVMNRSNPSVPVGPRLIRPREMRARLGISKVTLWHWWKHRAILPPPLRLGPRVVGWTEDDLAAALAKADAARREGSEAKAA